MVTRARRFDRADKAFVQSVAGQKPEPAPAGAALIKNPFAELVSNPVANVVPSEKSVAAEPIVRRKQTSGPPPLPAQSEVRKEIQTRIAAFQAHQHRFHREREAYFNSVLAKVRSDIETGRTDVTVS